MKNKGTALITALLLIALIADVVLIMLHQQHLALRRTQQVVGVDQSFMYALGAEDWAIGKVKEALQTKDNTLSWPIKMTKQRIPGGSIEARIEDAQARFNVNNLMNEKQLAGFSHMILALKPTLGEADADNVASAVRAWMIPQTATANSPTFTQTTKTSNRSAHQRLVSISELRLIDGIDNDFYKTLLPHVTALPTTASININTASAQVLQTVSESLTLDDAKSIVEYRDSEKGFKTRSDFVEFVAELGHPVDARWITTQSEYFLSRVDVRLGRQQFTLYTLFHIKQRNNNLSIKILWRSRGTL